MGGCCSSEFEVIGDDGGRNFPMNERSRLLSDSRRGGDDRDRWRESNYDRDRERGDRERGDRERERDRPPMWRDERDDFDYRERERERERRNYEGGGEEEARFVNDRERKREEESDDSATNSPYLGSAITPRTESRREKEREERREKRRREAEDKKQRQEREERERGQRQEREEREREQRQEREERERREAEARAEASRRINERVESRWRQDEEREKEKAREKSERKERERQEAERKERERLEAIEKERQMERERQMAIERERLAAIERERQQKIEAERERQRIERERLMAIERERQRLLQIEIEKERLRQQEIERQRVRRLKAVIYIQAHERGRQTRRKISLSRMRKAAILIQSTLRARQERQRYLTERACIIAIQARWRGKQQRAVYQQYLSAALVLQSVARTRQQQVLFISLRDMHRKRQHVAQETLQTEQSYYEILIILKEEFQKKLLAQAHKLKYGEVENSGESKRKEKDKDKLWVKRSEVYNIFAGLDVIVRIHKKLLANLTAVISDWHPHSSCIGVTLFNSMASMKDYTEFVNNYDRAMKLLGECMTNPQFAQFVHTLERQTSTKDRIIDLPSLLINPIQRIPRYEMLLRDMLKATDRDHLDYPDLVQALDKIKEIANYINNEKRAAEASERMTSLKSQLKGRKVQRRLFSRPGMELLREGTAIRVKKQDKEAQKEKEFCLFLFGGVLVTARPQSKKTKYDSHTSYRDSDEIELEGCKVFALSNEKPTFVVLAPSGKQFTWQVGTRTERDEWVAAIFKAATVADAYAEE